MFILQKRNTHRVTAQIKNVVLNQLEGLQWVESLAGVEPFFHDDNHFSTS